MDKSRRINLSLGRWVPMDQNAPKLVFTHAKEQVELLRIFFIHFSGHRSHFSKGHCSDLPKSDQSSQVFLWFTGFYISLWQITNGNDSQILMKSVTEKYENQWIREILGPFCQIWAVTFRKVIATAGPYNKILTSSTCSLACVKTNLGVFWTMGSRGPIFTVKYWFS